jgi:transcription antitermination factor NusG
VERCLRGKGYQAFSPFCQTTRNESGRPRVLDQALFPGYVFCNFNPNRRLPILTTPGVVYIIGTGCGPEPLEASEILSVLKLAESGQPVRPWPFLEEGQRIRIEAGPFSGAEGRLLRVKNQLQLVVSITLLQRSVAVVVDRDVVRALELNEDAILSRQARSEGETHTRRSSSPVLAKSTGAPALVVE